MMLRSLRFKSSVKQAWFKGSDIDPSGALDYITFSIVRSDQNGFELDYGFKGPQPMSRLKIRQLAARFLGHQAELYSSPDLREKNCAPWDAQAGLEKGMKIDFGYAPENDKPASFDQYFDISSPAIKI